ncbi:hypothetical protein FC83_GL001450 [Agrilactobacillus composti DSM 18527 = JCM 14202]|uniref:HTH cro/C1-type domain-containing protein n=1 Tax=Agrilactobacillus composti DSM 18527 = JCM 14202 TaxID=1423734 RepID=X0PG46_9LACO|nr:helix-turn-helix transcriptional regulator [Agrilactobacillus composti]KRM30889.1 hypothetical protein FC83_GL001450 [Agrilactobacillus composti DSM 18527 = JCM 14202]GAF40823.1 transcriptional regulator, XRE family [Agrilactobacillus composti DSM 18527 = JCM 14202]
MAIGKRLQERRNELAMTQDFVADQLGVSRQTVSNWENGRSYPDIERVLQLSELYHLSLDNLLKGDATMVHHLKTQTTINHFLKLFILLMALNISLMVVLLLLKTTTTLLYALIFALIGINTFSIFYLIIKKI